MASSGSLPAPSYLNLSDGNISQAWKKFKQKFKNYELAAGIKDKPGEIRVATLLTLIGDEALEVFNTFTFDNDAAKKNIDTVLTKFDEYCEPKKNIVYDRYIFNARMQKSNESIDQYITELKKLSESCEFGTLKNSLIRDRIVLGICDDRVRERLLRDRNLTLQQVIDYARSSEMTQLQMKEIKAEEHTVHYAERKHKKETRREETRREMRFTKECRYCGKKHEFKKELCPAYGKECKKCGLKNHFALKCKKKEYDRKVNYVHENEEEDDELELYAVTNQAGKKKKWFHTLNLNDKKIKFLIDTGATCNVLSRKDLLSLFDPGEKVKVVKSRSRLMMYNGDSVTPIGRKTLRCTEKKKNHDIEFEIMNKDVTPVLSGETCVKLNLVKIMTNEQGINVICRMKKEDTMTRCKKLTEKYKDVFEGLGKLPGKYHIDVDPTVKPVIHPPRKVSFALKEKLRDKLEELERRGIIETVTVPTDWVSSMVTVVKPNKLRVCIDPKDLNRAIKRPHYPIPTLDEMTAKLTDVKIFSVLDAKNGFWQIELDEDSSVLTCFNSPFGRKKWKRLPFGLNSASEEFQRRIKEILEGLNGIHVIADDILVTGSGENIEEAKLDHLRNFEKLLQRARENKLKLNKEKMKLELEEVEYHGHLLSARGIRPNPKRIEAIKKMPTPHDVKAVQRLLGSVNYMRNFLPNLSKIAEPLRRLEDKDVEWHWTEVHEEALNEIKNLLTSPPILKYFDVKKEVRIQCDSSEKGNGACLLQEGQPIAYTSRALTKTEINYAQIEKEMLAIVNACDKFDQYIFGRKAIIETDHKPIEAIYKKPLYMAPKRLQRMLLKLQKYDLDIVFKPGKELFIADTLSRAFLKNNEDEKMTKFYEINLLEDIPVADVRIQEFKNETENDKILKKIKEYILNGWKNDNDVKPYLNFKDEISLQDGILFKGDRIIVPASMRKNILRQIHSSHIGIESCLRRARELVFWPNMNGEIKDCISKCDICNTYRTNQQKEPIVQAEPPERPWSKVGVDLFDFKNEKYLIAVDYWSNYFEFNKLKSEQSKSTITVLKSYFSRHGIPDIIYSDNGPQFSAREFKEFSNNYQFKHITSSPRYPQSNGKVENSVKTIKRILTKADKDNSDPYLAILDWRNTPSETYNCSPVQRLMGRRTKTLLPTAKILLKPEIQKNVIENYYQTKEKQKYYYDRESKSLPNLNEGDVVRIKPDLPRKEWRKGTCMKKVNPRSYKINCDGQILRRNRRHLIKTEENVCDREEETLDSGITENPPETVNIQPSSSSVARSRRQTRLPCRLQDYIVYH